MQTSTHDRSNLLQTFRANLERFFFSEEIPYGLALVRIFLPFVLLIVNLPRWYWVREIFSADGAPAPLCITFNMPYFLPILPGNAAVALFALMLMLMVTSSIGWYSRLSLIGLTVLYFWITMSDSLSTLNKYTVISTHVLMLLAVSNCGAVWSVDAWLASRRQLIPSCGSPDHPRFPIWPQRLIQLLIGVVYFGAAVTKLHTPTFFSGDQLVSWMMSNYNGSHPLGDYLTQYPGLIVTFSYITIVWEVMFLFLCWQGMRKYLALTIGATFHVMTVLTLGLYAFAPIMISIYLAFFTEGEYRAHYQWLRRLRRQYFPRLLRGPYWPTWSPEVSPATSALLYTGCMACVMWASIAAEHRLDPYGERRPGGPYELKEVSREQIQKMVVTEQKVREKDRFLTFDVGSSLIAGRLMNRQTSYHFNDTVVCEANLSPPHPDMWVECNLHDSQNRVIARLGQVVTRELLRAFFTYTITEAIPAGDYWVVLKSRGQEVSRRKITLLPNVSSPVAN